MSKILEFRSMILKQEYIEYLLSTPFNYTCTNMADHKPNRPAARLSHDVVSDFLRRDRFTPADLWAIVQGYIDDSLTALVIVDDSVQDKRYSRFIELVKKQYSGNEHGTVKGIGLVNFVHTAGNDEQHWPIDYRIFYPESDGKAKNDHFQEMFKRLITHKHLKAMRILFDSWYASVDNLNRTADAADSSVGMDFLHYTAAAADEEQPTGQSAPGYGLSALGYTSL